MNVTTLTLPELEHLLEEYPWFTLARKEYVRRQGKMGEDALRRAAAEAGMYLMSRSEFLDELQGKSRSVRRKESVPAEQPDAGTRQRAAVQPAESQTAEAVPAVQDTAQDAVIDSAEAGPAAQEEPAPVETVDDIIDPVIEKPARSEEEKPKYYVVNGDYFDKEDYRELEQEGLAFDTSALVFNPIASAISAMEDAPAPAVQPKVEVREDNDDSFITETLAKIYLEQEFYQRAIDIYEKLILLYPKKSAYFATLIEQAKNIKQ